MKTITNEELLIQFLNSEFKKQRTNEVSVSRKDVEELKLSEKEAARLFYVLQTDGYIYIKTKSVHDDFSRFWVITLTSKCLHYFENKEGARIEKRNIWIQFWIPVGISIVAIVISIITLIIELQPKLPMQL